jgi:hypothetical protein
VPFRLGPEKAQKTTGSRFDPESRQRDPVKENPYPRTRSNIASSSIARAKYHPWIVTGP